MLSYTNGMTLEEQIGQLFVAGFDGTSPSPEITHLIQHYHVGNVILFSRNIQTTRQVRELTQRLQTIARAAGQRYPLLITLDQENGMVSRLGQDATTFPGNMALGAIGSEQIACEVAQATGRELKALGINMNLAPVADVNNNPANPVIGIRSFGEDPNLVASLAAAMVKGYQAAGVIATLKHFPGHGDTAVDSHLSLPVIPYNMERLSSIELVPFQRGIEAGVGCVMLAHIALPALTGDTALPATVSSVIVRDVLRERLGFAGVVMTDCLEMQAISKGIGIEQGSVRAVKAGVDLVLISHRYERQRAGIEAVYAAVREGVITPAEIQQAAERVLRLKHQWLSWDDFSNTANLAWVGSEANRQLRDRVYALSTTLVRNEAGLIPLRLQPAERILIVSPQRDEAISQAEEKDYPDGFLAECIRQRHSAVTEIALTAHPTEGDYQQILQAARTADLVIMVTVSAYRDQQQVTLAQRLLRTGQRIIGIAVHTPYDLLAFPQLRTYLVTYEYTRPALEAAMRILFGEAQPQGRLPVTLPGLV